MNSQDVLTHYRKASLLSSVQALAGWDMETYMPRGATDLRGRQLGLLSEIHHREMTRPDFVRAVLESDPSRMSGGARSQMIRLQDEVRIAQAHSPDFISRREELRVKCQGIWHEAKSKRRFALVAPALTELVEIEREWADRVRSSPALRQKYSGSSLYEVHLDQYEPGQSADAVRGGLHGLGAGLKKLLPRIIERQGKASRKKGSGSRRMAMPTPRQRELCEQVASALGFDFSRGRLDVSAHPFCGGSPRDVRMTVRHDEKDFTSALYSLIHETGHALYEQGLPEESLDTPCGRAISLGFHESQSRFMENQLGRSDAFIAFISRKTGIPAEQLAAHLRKVELSHIRTESDEVTYNLHILLRMRIEEDLIEGRLRVNELPERWNADFRELFGIRVPHDALGCLQDIHWYGGAFGYFPTYSIGNLIAAELFARFSGENPKWAQAIRRGSFAGIVEFLRDRVHRRAAFDNSPDSLVKVIGRSMPDPTVFLAYLEERYL
jgi:carboxypeptidase Taq